MGGSYREPLHMGGHLGGDTTREHPGELPYTPYEPLASVFSPPQGGHGATPKGVLVEHPACAHCLGQDVLAGAHCLWGQAHGPPTGRIGG